MRYNGRLPGDRALFWYAGTKWTGHGIVDSFFPDDIDRLVSPFFGRGDLEFFWAHRTGKPVVGYDLMPELVAFWQVILSNPARLSAKVREGALSLPDRGLDDAAYSEWWRGRRAAMRETGDPVEKAYLFALTQFGSLNGYGDTPGPVKKRPGMADSISNLRNLSWRDIRRFESPSPVTVEQADFRDSMVPHRDDFLYLDPPYPGIESIHVDSDDFPHQELADLCRDHRGGFVMSNRAHPWVLDAYSWAKVETIQRRLPSTHGKKRESHDEILIIGDPK